MPDGESAKPRVVSELPGLVEATAVTTIPPEVVRFFSEPQPQVLLLRGASGAGKTTFALTTLRQFPGRRVFVSARADRERLENLFPWLAEEPVAIEVHEAEPGSASAAWLRRAKPKGSRARGSAARRDRAARKTEFEWLPPSLRELWKSLDGGRPTLVAIDSWDGFVEAYLESPTHPGPSPDERLELERALLRRLQGSGVHLLMVAERDAESALDYLVDGIVSLSVLRVQDRPERWLQIRKLRGGRIDEPDYPFTLQGALFETMRPFPSHLGAHDVHAEPDATPVAGSLWPGCGSFARAFGRLPLGEMSLLEVEAGVPSEGLRLILFPMIDAVLAQGGGVLLSMPPSMSVPQVWELLREKLSAQEFIRQVRVLATGRASDVGEEVRAAFLSLPDASDHRSPLLRESIDFVNRGPDAAHGSASFQWHRGLKLLCQGAGVDYTPETAPRIAQQFIAGGTNHLMVIGSDGDPVFSALSDMASTFLRLNDRRGRVLISGVRPRTPAFLLAYAAEPAPYRLVRMV